MSEDARTISFRAPQQLDVLRTRFGDDRRQPGDVSSRPSEARGEALADGIGGGVTSSSVVASITWSMTILSGTSIVSRIKPI